MSKWAARHTAGNLLIRARMCLATAMKTRKEKPLKAVGDTLIGFGAILCILSVVLFLIGAFSGVANGGVISGGCTIGLLMVIAGNLQRINAVLLRKAETEVSVTAP